MGTSINILQPAGTGGTTPIDYTSLLNTIITAVQAVDANTDTVEALLSTVNTTLGTLDSDDDATGLSTINTTLGNAITELQSIESNTDNVETLISAMQVALVAEHDQSQVILSDILTELQAGIDVNVTNQIDLTALENTLTSVLTQATAINANTDTVEALLQTVITDIGNLDSDDDAVALANISTQLGTVITELQDVDANTDALETLIAAVTVAVTAEGDQTQLLLAAIDAVLDAINAKMVESDLTLTEQSGVNTNVPAGAKSVTISNISGTTTINGTFELGAGRRPDSISFGGSRGNYINEILPAYTLSGGTWQWIALF